MLRGNSGFRWYFLGSVTSDFGTWLQNSAQVLLAYQLAHSVLTVGLVTFAQFTSPLVLGPWAGVATDKFGGRRTLLGTQVVSAGVAATLAGLDFAGLLNAWVLVAGAIITGLAFTFALPARNVTVQRLVPADKLKPAYAMDSVSYNLGRAVAPAADDGHGPARDQLRVGLRGERRVVHRLQRDPLAGPHARGGGAGAAVAGAGRLPDRPPRPPHHDPAADGGRGHRRGRPDPGARPGARQAAARSPAWSGWFIAALGAGTVCGSFRRSKHQPTIRLAATALAALALFMLLFVYAPTCGSASSLRSAPERAA